jgi:predicted lipoprotein with Yx(FWY)xxD motif
MKIKEDQMTSKSVIVISALLFTTATTGTSALAEGEYGPLKMTKTTVGEVLTTPEGMTLYTFDKDKKGVSNCKGDCAKMWPPLKAEKGAKPTGNLTIVKRHDGTMQWADEGQPLYTYAKDKKPGDVTGDNVGSVWHVAK